MSTPLWRQTPLIHSAPLSNNIGASVYLKLENVHPSLSFKYRGLSHFISKAKEKHGKELHCIVPSGGNAALAGACAARALGVKCTVFIPEGIAPSTLARLRQENAEVVVTGRFYAEAMSAAQQAVAADPAAVLVPPYDDPLIWEGHSSMIEEIWHQLGRKPDAFFCCVGGGGLLGGIIEGCGKVGWDDVPIVALETIGSDCFYHSITMNGNGPNAETKKLPPGTSLVRHEGHDLYLAHFNEFSSRASGSLGASEPSATVLRMALDRPGGVYSYSVPDELSMGSLIRFADDHKLLVELACSTTLVPAYHPTLFDRMVPPTSDTRCVVFIVCGGFKISLSDAGEFREIVEKDKNDVLADWEVLCPDGERFRVSKQH